jgi:hypothetical protein
MWKTGAYVEACAGAMQNFNQIQSHLAIFGIAPEKLVKIIDEPAS